VRLTFETGLDLCAEGGLNAPTRSRRAALANGPVSFAMAASAARPFGESRSRFGTGADSPTMNAYWEL